MISMRFNSPASAKANARPSGDQNCDEFVGSTRVSILAVFVSNECSQNR